MPINEVSRAVPDVLVVSRFCGVLTLDGDGSSASDFVFATMTLGDLADLFDADRFIGSRTNQTNLIAEFIAWQRTIVPT